MKRLLVLLIFSACAMAQVATVPGRKIMLFGGVNHTTYLGCLSCNEFASDSVLNTFGRYASEFQTGSIFNSFGPYGSKFQSTSACNDFATNPPVIVDNRGAYYGELTLNESRPKRVRNDDVLAWLAAICEDH